jgi:hypothetical protein
MGTTAAAQPRMGRKIHIRRKFNGFSDRHAAVRGTDDVKYRLAWIKYMYGDITINRNCVTLEYG